MKIRSYSEILELLKKDKLIYEQAMHPSKISNLKRLKDSGDIKSVLKILKKDIDIIIDICKNISFDDIYYSMEDDIITIFYAEHIMTLLSTLKGKIREYSTEEIDDRIFGGGWKALFLEVEIDKDMLNRIDIINGLPNFIKGIGLGKKIYKKLIKEFGYISSFDGYEPSLDSSMVWESLANDNELFIFSNDENLIFFCNELEYETIINKLKEFYENKGSIQFDDDFLIRYNLTNDILKELI